MKKATSKKKRNGLRGEYDVKALQGGDRGKYYRRYTAGTNLVLLDPDIADAFPSAKDVNEALRVLVNVASKRVRRPRRGKRA
jgi:hypothetical protein